MPQYIAEGFKMVVEDEYEHGEIGSTQDMGEMPEFTATTIEKLIEKLMNFLDVPREWVIVGEIEPHRIDINRLEDSEGEIASKVSVEAWKQGKRRLWSARYTYYVNKMTAVDLLSEMKREKIR